MNKEIEIFLNKDKNCLEVIFGNTLNNNNIQEIETAINDAIKKNIVKKIEFNLKNLQSIDSAGAIFLVEQKQILLSQKYELISFGLSEQLSEFLNLCKENMQLEDVDINQKSTIKLSYLFYKIGFFTTYCYKTSIKFLSFLGEMVIAIIRNLTNPKRLRPNAINFHIQRNGVGALPIIAITSFLIGIVITYQGATILQDFGANIYVVDFLGVGVCREIAPLIVAIVIAGRSASAFTAEIGVMNITDEVDAMKTLGFSLWDFLILPRTFALIISLPLLVFFADVISIIGGMVVSKAQLGIHYVEFIERFQSSVELKHIVIGLIKAPFFGFIIAMVGCFRGFEITGNTQNVGKYTTLSVVSAIFWVIAFDALASVFFTNIGI